MPVRTARYLVDRTREEVQIFDLAPLRDGFAADADDTPGTQILAQINRAMHELNWIGLWMCDFALATVAGQREYTLDPDIHEIRSVILVDPAINTRTWVLVPMGPEAVQRDRPYWRDETARRPQYYYIDGDILGFVAKPDMVYDVTIRASVTLADLVLDTDTPQRLPEAYHELLVSGAAYKISRMAAANEAARIRMAELKGEWEEGKARLLSLAQSRMISDNEQITVDDYRSRWRTGRAV